MISVVDCDWELTIYGRGRERQVAFMVKKAGISRVKPKGEGNVMKRHLNITFGLGMGI